MVEFFHAMYEYTPHMLAIAILAWSLSIILTSINLTQKETINMKTVPTPTKQTIDNAAQALLTIDRIGYFTLCATSLAVSKDAKVSKSLYKSKDPVLETLKSSAKWAWQNLGDYAPVAIIHLGQYIDANLETFGAKLDTVSGKYLTPFGFWGLQNHSDQINSLFATLGYRPNVVATPTPQVVQAPIVANIESHVKPLPVATPQFNAEPYPKRLEVLGVVFHKANKPVKSDGSVIYAKGDANKVITKGMQFSDNGLTYVVTSVKFGGKSIDVRLSQAVQAPSVTPQVVATPTPQVVATPTPQVTDTNMLLIQMLQQMNQRLDKAGL